jgi:hypothetical protein
LYHHQPVHGLGTCCRCLPSPASVSHYAFARGLTGNTRMLCKPVRCLERHFWPGETAPSILHPYGRLNFALAPFSFWRASACTSNHFCAIQADSIASLRSHGRRGRRGWGGGTTRRKQK